MFWEENVASLSKEMFCSVETSVQDDIKIQREAPTIKGIIVCLYCHIYSQTLQRSILHKNAIRKERTGIWSMLFKKIPPSEARRNICKYVFFMLFDSYDFFRKSFWRIYFIQLKCTNNSYDKSRKLIQIKRHHRRKNIVLSTKKLQYQYQCRKYEKS